jgi:threonine/homoserine/homoserine lactone efflux protein
MHTTLNLIELFIKGIIVGYFASIPLGPIGIICIQRTLSKGKLSGFVSGLGASTADTFLSIIAGLSLSIIIDFVYEYINIFKFLGGALVIFIGIRIFLKNPVRQYRAKRMKKKSSFHTDYLSTLVLTLSNPLNIFLYLAVFTAFNIVKGVKTVEQFCFIFTGIFIGTALWWFTLTALVSKYHDKFNIKNLWWLNKISGILIAILGLATLISILF